MPSSSTSNPMQSESSFNIEEFVNISIIDSEENFQSMPAETQWPTSWDTREVSLEGTLNESFTFSSLETTPMEEYVDPFADLLLPSAAQPQEAEAFKEKLLFRRQKLDDLAKKLSKKDDQTHWFLDADCKSPANPGYWACERTPVQVYRLEAVIPDIQVGPYADLVKRSSSLYSSAVSSSKFADELTQEEKEICTKLLPTFTSLHLL